VEKIKGRAAEVAKIHGILNEPSNNINGGLGMFTAFNSDTVSMVLLPQK